MGCIRGTMVGMQAVIMPEEHSIIVQITMLSVVSEVGC